MALFSGKKHIAHPRRLIVVIAAAAAIAYGVAAYLLLILPRLSVLSAARGPDSQALADRVSAAEARAGQIRTAVASYAALSDDKKTMLDAIVPPAADVPDLMVQLDAIATAHGMAIVSVDTLTDEKTATPAGRKVVRVALNLSGGQFDQFKGFLSDLERSQRIFDAQSVIFTPGSNAYSVVLDAYFAPAAQTAQ